MKTPPSSQPPADAPKAPAVTAAIGILRQLAGAPSPQGVTAIAKAVGLSPSSCFNILRTLASESFVHFDPATKAYTLGLGSIALARKALDPSAALDLVRPQLEDMARRFDVATSLWRISMTDRLVLIGLAESPATTRIHLTVGQRLPKYLGAMGRTVAAHTDLEGKAFAEQFAALRWDHAPDLASYKAEVAKVRSRGWAIDVDNFMLGVTSIAAPVLDRTGDVRFCISNIFFSGQRGPADLNILGEATVALAEDFSRRLFSADF